MIDYKQQKKDAIKLLFTMAKLLETPKDPKTKKTRPKAQLPGLGYYTATYAGLAADYQPANTKIAITGGAVADWMLGRAANDVDIFTDYTIEDIDAALAHILEEAPKVLGNEEKSKSYGNTHIEKVYEFYKNGTKYNVIVCQHLLSTIASFPMTISKGYLMINTSTSQLAQGPVGFRELLTNKVNLITDTHCLPHEDYFLKKRKNYPDFNFCFDPSELKALITNKVKKTNELYFIADTLKQITWQDRNTLQRDRKHNQVMMGQSFRERTPIPRILRQDTTWSTDDDAVTEQWMQERHRELLAQQTARLRQQVAEVEARMSLDLETLNNARASVTTGTSRVVWRGADPFVVR
jgi:hypothetical protein